ncbi:MAG: 50S ribosomal protein L4 [Bacteroidota bacterium]
MELAVYNKNGEKTTRCINLDDEIFNVEPNDHAIYLDAKQYQANQRQGTHKAKEKWEISRTTKKLKRQKGTGGARAGSMKSPLFRGGGRVFGPRPRDYSFKLNKKLKRVARRSALSYKARENQIFILEDFSFDVPKTQNYIDLLKNFKLEGQRTLMVTHGVDKNIILSARNLQKTEVSNALDLNTYDILKANTMFIMESSIKDIEQIAD